MICAKRLRVRTSGGQSAMTIGPPGSWRRASSTSWSSAVGCGCQTTAACELAKPSSMEGPHVVDDLRREFLDVMPLHEQQCLPREGRPGCEQPVAELVVDRLEQRGRRRAV